VDAIKLDRRFFKESADPKAEQLLACIIELSRTLGACTVAEGIETKEQLALLKKVQCDQVQGYIYAKPMPIADFEGWLADRNR